MSNEGEGRTLSSESEANTVTISKEAESSGDDGRPHADSQAGHKHGSSHPNSDPPTQGSHAPSKSPRSPGREARTRSKSPIAQASGRLVSLFKRSPSPRPLAITGKEEGVERAVGSRGTHLTEEARHRAATTATGKQPIPRLRARAAASTRPRRSAALLPPRAALSRASPLKCGPSEWRRRPLRMSGHRPPRRNPRELEQRCRTAPRWARPSRRGRFHSPCHRRLQGRHPGPYRTQEPVGGEQKRRPRRQSELKR